MRVRNLSWKIKRSFSNLSYKFRALHLLRIKPIKPSMTAAVLAMTAFAIFILAGGIFDVLMNPLALLPKPGGGGWTFIYPGGVHMQTVNESLVSAFIYALGTLGLYILLRSTRSAYKPRQAYLLLIIGFIATFIAVYYSSSLLQEKVSG
jgi:uncharacterized membrane protein